MSITDTNVVDMIGIDSNGEKVCLAISDHLEWDPRNEHLLLLQEKINTYLRFIESGQLYKNYPSAQGLACSIEVIFMRSPPDAALDFLSQAQLIVREAGYDLTHTVK